MDETKLRAGSVIIGAPADPIHPTVIRAFAAAVAAIPDVREAHLPFCFVPGVNQTAAPVLVLVVDAESDIKQIMESLAPRLQGIVPPGAQFDVWPLPPDHELLPAIRKANCRLGGADSTTPPTVARKWWQLWR